jgi:hypothetical protein
MPRIRNLPNGTPSSRAAQRLKNAQTFRSFSSVKTIEAFDAAHRDVCRQDDGVPSVLTSLVATSAARDGGVPSYPILTFIF